MDSKELNKLIKEHVVIKVGNIFALDVIRDRYKVGEYPNINNMGFVENNNFDVDIEEFKEEPLGLYGGKLNE